MLALVCSEALLVVEFSGTNMYVDFDISELAQPCYEDISSRRLGAKEIQRTGS